MKRILTAILCAGILAVTAAGCSYNDALYKDSNSSSQNGEDSTQPTTSSVSDQKYSDNLDGLVDYFVAKQSSNCINQMYQFLPVWYTF